MKLETKYIYVVLLALQFGVQPFLMKKFVSETESASCILMCEVCKIILCLASLLTSKDGRKELSKWSFKSSLMSSIPAILYTLQNFCLQASYSKLSPTAFILINQTKILWGALFAFILIGDKQTRGQVVALFGLLSAAVMISLQQQKPSTSALDNMEDDSQNTLMMVFAVIPALLAAILSGFNAGVSQLLLQGKKTNGEKPKGKNSFIYSMELGFYSIVALLPRIFTLFVKYNRTHDALLLQNIFGFQSSFFHGWTVLTFIPIISNSIGGLLVGQVVKTTSSVVKGYALVFGVLITSALDIALGARLTIIFAVAVVVASASMVLHIRAAPKREVKKV